MILLDVPVHVEVDPLVVRPVLHLGKVLTGLVGILEMDVAEGSQILKLVVVVFVILSKGLVIFHVMPIREILGNSDLLAVAVLGSRVLERDHVGVDVVNLTALLALTNVHLLLRSLMVDRDVSVHPTAALHVLLNYVLDLSWMPSLPVGMGAVLPLAVVL